MEEYLKFVVYAIAFLVYIVTQIRKVKNKAEVPVPSEQPDPVVIREQRRVVEDSRRNLDTSGSAGEGSKDTRLFKHKKEEVKIIKEYKSLDEIAEEERQAAQLLQKRQKTKGEGVKDKVISKDEHFDAYTLKDKKENDAVNWLRNKSNLKKAFVAAEILQKKY